MIKKNIKIIKYFLVIKINYLSLYQENQPIKIKVMNATDLKNNREAIISRIREVADNSKMAEIMQSMLRLVEGGMNEANNPLDLVDEVVELLGYQKKYDGRPIDEVYAEMSRNQRGSSMR